MAECRKVKTVKYRLILTDQEAEYLLGILQNDLSGGETESQGQCRCAIFTALKCESSVPQEEEIPY